IASNKHLVQTQNLVAKMKMMETPYNGLGFLIQKFDSNHVVPGYVNIFDSQCFNMDLKKYNEADVMLALQKASTKPSLWRNFLKAAKDYNFSELIDVSKFFFEDGATYDVDSWFTDRFAGYRIVVDILKSRRLKKLVL